MQNNEEYTELKDKDNIEYYRCEYCDFESYLWRILRKHIKSKKHKKYKDNFLK